jgi:hypothetical protein
MLQLVELIAVGANTTSIWFGIQITETKSAESIILAMHIILTQRCQLSCSQIQELRTTGKI